MKKSKTLRLFPLLLALLCTVNGVPQPRPPALKISPNQRFLVKADGTAFFYLGDTAWEIFHRLNREDVQHYLRKRAAQGFTVIQAVALAEFDGLNEPNAYGHRPLVDNDPTKPDVKPGAQDDYWDHVDFVINQAAALGLYIGFLPTWGDKWNKKSGVGPEIFMPQNAETYGAWLGQRYKDAPNIIWILGGDRPIENDTHRAIIRAMATGLRQDDGGAHLITFHPGGNQGSAQYFHDEAWLDFNMRQNGHNPEFTNRYENTRRDYDRTPIKPVLDGEPLYEDHPLSFRAREQGHSVASDVRRPLYWDLFSGACGHTYGHHSIWQFAQPGRKPVNNPLLPWREALDQPGANQMQHARRLLESRPLLTRIPDDALIVPADPSSAVPGAGTKRFVATRDAEGRYAMIYAPTGRPFSVRLDKLRGNQINAWWFDPRTGQATLIGQFAKTPTREFVTPAKGEDMDWVLVLDDAAQRFPTPGKLGR